MAEKRAWTDKSDTEIDTEGVGEVSTSQSQSRYMHMPNICLTDLEEEAIVNFVKDHKELYDKTNEHFKDRTRKACLWERLAKSHKLSVKVCTTYFKSQRTRYGKLTQSKFSQAPKEMAEA